MNSVDSDDAQLARRRMARRHLRLGWWGLAVFATLGLLLEALHGFKLGLYLDVGNEARRLTWRLAHAHGTLLSVVNIALGLTLLRPAARALRAVWSASLAASTLLIPLGFLCGGVFLSGSDPGVAIVLVPLGALLLVVALIGVARST